MFVCDVLEWENYKGISDNENMISDDENIHNDDYLERKLGLISHSVLKFESNRC